MREAAEFVGSVRSHVYRAARRLRDRGREGLFDGRRDTGKQLATAAFDIFVLELIHYSHEARRALRRLDRIRLRFLPPYCPEHNANERFRQDLHANVMRNHTHADLLPLCGAVAEYFDSASAWIPRSS